MSCMSDAAFFTSAFQVRKRDGRIVPFQADRISRAILSAFRADYGLSDQHPLDPQVMQVIEHLTSQVTSNALFEASRNQGVIDVERVQDLVETQLMHAGEYRVARRYILYRRERSLIRAARGQTCDKNVKAITVRRTDGSVVPIDYNLIKRKLFQACHGFAECSAADLLEDLATGLYDGITDTELERMLVMVARQRIERDPSYSQVAARLLLQIIYQEALGFDDEVDLQLSLTLFDSLNRSQKTWQEQYVEGFRHMLETGVKAGRIDAKLLDFNCESLSRAIRPERDQRFQYLGLQTLYDRYLIHIEGRRIETPQYFWMRVAMGLCLHEKDRESKAIEFYEVLSTFRFVSATPTLFNSGTPHPQLSSCYLTTVDDDLRHIFKCIQDNALLSKWAGGLGNDWTRVRATGAHIQGTNGKSQGIIPFLKVANDTALAVNQGGKRKGAVCAYLETWHLDIEEFLELRKNTGDDRRRTHDMHTAHWIPDLFMRRVRQNAHWTLFSPNEVPDLHELYGEAFDRRYEQYEAMADRGEIKLFRRINAVDLWRKMLSMVFETGHPWLTFKDPSNLRSPQDHAGVIHNSNLCTEILLNTSNEETAVCNLGSINMKEHVAQTGVNWELLRQTIRTAVRMLDNVIDINFYPTAEAQNANRRHRPIGLGLMGVQDALFIRKIPFASHDAIEFADQMGEFISYHAILASTELAHERGTYESYKGSKWDRGLLPIDTIALLKQVRGDDLDMDTTTRMDWTPVREAISTRGMRNSNVMAIAPTATISNIAGCYQSIEPSYRNLFVKSNLSGDFIIINQYLVNDLKAIDLWDERMIEDLKYYDGELGPIERIPQDIKKLYQTAFEMDPYFLIEANSRRQKWIDMGISFNLYLSEPDGKSLSQMYMTCWEKGLKTTYYLRSRAATQIEKASVDVNRYGIQPKWMKNRSESASVIPNFHSQQNVCSLTDPTCEACQ